MAGINARLQSVDLLGAVELDFDPPNNTAASTGPVAVPIPGVMPGDLVIPFETENVTGLAFGNSAIVSTPDEALFPHMNVTSGAINAPSQTMRFLVFRPTTDVIPASL